MNTITITGAEISTTLYFPTEASMIMTLAKIIARGSWNRHKGVYKLVTRVGSRQNKYYADAITAEIFNVIHEQVEKWNEAKEMARKRVGNWVWQYGNEYLRRHMTLLQIKRLQAQQV